MKPRTFLAGLAASLAAAVLIALAMAVLGEYTKTRGRSLLTALSLAGFCLLALSPSVLASRGRYSGLAAVGVLAPGLGFVLVVVGLWATPDPDAFWKAAAIISIAAGSTAYCCWVLLFTAQRSAAQVAQYAALGVASLVLFLTSLAIIAEIREAAFWWVVALLVIALIVCGPVAAAPGRRPSTQSSSPRGGGP